MTVEEFLERWCPDKEEFPFIDHRAKMKADLEEMLQDVGQKAAQAGYELGRKPMGNTVSWNLLAKAAWQCSCMDCYMAREEGREQPHKEGCRDI